MTWPLWRWSTRTDLTKAIHEIDFFNWWAEIYSLKYLHVKGVFEEFLLFYLKYLF